MKSELIYVSDTYCLWCYAISKTIARVASEYSAKLTVRIVHGGMIAGDRTLRAFFERFPDPVGLHKHVASVSNANFGEPYLYQIRNLKRSKRILNSLYPSFAIEALRVLGVEDTLAVSGKIYEAHYVRGLDLNSLATYADIVPTFGVECDDFKKQFCSLSVRAAVGEDLNWVNKIGVSGFPALLLKRSDNHYKMVARGFVTHQALKQELDLAVSERISVEGTAGTACDVNSGRC